MIAYIVTAAISVSAGVLGMGMWCGRKHMTAARIENVITLIDSIPHRNGKETRIKAMLRGEA